MGHVSFCAIAFAVYNVCLLLSLECRTVVAFNSTINLENDNETRNDCVLSRSCGLSDVSRTATELYNNSSDFITEDYTTNQPVEVLKVSTTEFHNQYEIDSIPNIVDVVTEFTSDNIDESQSTELNKLNVTETQISTITENNDSIISPTETNPTATSQISFVKDESVILEDVTSEKHLILISSEANVSDIADVVSSVPIVDKKDIVGINEIALEDVTQKADRSTESNAQLLEEVNTLTSVEEEILENVQNGIGTEDRIEKHGGEDNNEGSDAVQNGIETEDRIEKHGSEDNNEGSDAVQNGIETEDRIEKHGSEDNNEGSDAVQNGIETEDLIEKHGSEDNNEGSDAVQNSHNEQEDKANDPAKEASVEQNNSEVNNNASNPIKNDHIENNGEDSDSVKNVHDKTNTADIEVSPAQDQPTNYHSEGNSVEESDRELKIINIKTLIKEKADNLINELDSKKEKLLNKNIGKNINKSRTRQTSLAFVFDATGSMYDDLVQLREGAELILQAMLEREDKPIKDYILVPYRDPEVGPVTVTSDPDVFKEELEKIEIYGGGDCPESALTGIEAALNVSMSYSYVYVFTDATATDVVLVNKILNLVQRKQSQVVFVLTGDCNERSKPQYQVYEQIAAASSGQILHLQKSDVKQILTYVKESLNSDRVNLNTIVNPPGEHKHKLPVDETLREVTISVAGRKPKVSFINPSGETVDGPPKLIPLIDLEDVQVVNLINPEPGDWTINVGSPEQHSVKITGLSNITFSHGFSVNNPAKMEDTAVRPLQGTQNYLMISVDNDVELDKLVSAEIINVHGDIFYEIPLSKVDSEDQMTLLYKADPSLPPGELFNIAINGQDKNGNPFRRISKTGIQAQQPEKPRLTVTSKIFGQYHEQISLRCRAESLVPINIWWFRNGHPVMTKEEHIQSATVEYVVPDLTEDTEGSYVCKATNIAGHSAAETEVVITGAPPVANLVPSSITAKRNTTVTLSCLVDSNLPVIIKILFKGLSGNESPHSVLVENIDQSFQGSKSVSFPLSEELQGTYSCLVTNRAGSSEKESIVKIRPPMRVKASPKIVEFQKTGTLSLSCIIHGTMDGKWTMQNNDIIDSLEDSTPDWEITQVPIDNNKGIQLFLDVKHPNKKHEALYDCHGYRDNEEVSATVEARYVEAPSINMKHNNLLFELDTMAVIDCETSGTPPPFIYWYGLDGIQIITEDEIAKRIHVNEMGQLVIHNINPIDNGKYVCKAENQFGTVSADIEITVFQKPFFTEIPQDQAVNIYTSTVLTCKADGIPKPKVTWFFNSLPFIEVELLADSGVNLHLRNVELKHNGTYSCVAENEYDTIKEDVFLDVVGLEPPVIYKGNRTVVLSEGDSYKFVCRFVRGKPHPKLFWRKNGLNVWDGLFGSSGDSEEDTSGGEGSNMEFIVNNIMRDQEGNYSCIGKNIVGEDRYDFTLEVYSPPKFVSSQADGDDYDYEDTNLIVKPLEVIAGEKMVLNCGVHGKPEPLITWSKDGIPVVYTNIVSMDDGSSLVMVQVRETDGGLYTCFASNPAGTLHKNFTVDVLVRPTVLNESLVDRIVQTVEGQLVMLPCPIHAIPSPHVVWTYDDEVISFSNRMQMDSDNTLRFVSNWTDAGIYRCEAVNKAGNTSKEYVVLIYAPPYVYPSGNEVIKTKENEKVSLECNAVGIPIPTIRWIKNGHTLTNSSTDYEFTDTGKLNITKASKNTTGIYVCEAENLAGLSEKLFHVIMNEAPNILPSEVSANIQLLAGEEEFNIPCKASGSPTPYTTWLKNGKYIVNDLHLKVQTDGTLSLRLITEKLNGKYTCQAANTEGSIEIDYNVHVIAPPTLLETEENGKTIIATEGSTAILECPLRPTHVLPKVEWSKNSELLGQIATHSKLMFDNVSRSDAAEYSCLASNEGGRVTATFKLMVQWPPIFTGNVTDKEEHLHFLEGEPMKLSCHVDANPGADVQWLKNLEMIGDISPVFKRNYMKTHHAGEHICIASNPHGQIKKKFIINVSAPPVIDGPPKVDMEVRLGQPVRLDCFASGYPKPVIEWITPYSSDWDMIGDGRILKAFNISSKSEGIFSCKAKNKAGDAAKHFNIKVLEPPKIPNIMINDTAHESSSLSLQFGSNMTVSCFSSGHPPSTVMWVRNGMILNKDLVTVNKSDLHLINVQMQDSGKYTCLTKNKVGSEEMDITVDVLVVPEILNDMTSDMYFIENNKSKQRWQKIETAELEPVRMDCRSLGNPTPDIYWFKNKKYLGFYDSNMLTQDQGQVLVIHKVLREHMGNYTCVARNKVGEDKMYFNLDVWVSPFVDQQKDGGQIYVMKKGQNVHLECPVASNPAPKIRWLKGPYTEITANEKNTHYQLRDAGSSLLINNVTAFDNGNYSCIGTNIVGMVEMLFSVEVLEEPKFLEETQDVKKSNMFPNGTIVTKVRRSFQLVCNVVAHPEPDIVWYKDGFRLHKTFTGDALHISRDGKFLNVMDAQLHNAGTYVCNAFNKVGSVEKEFNVKVLVPAEWSTWSPWSECSESCGPGVSTRTRDCQFQGDPDVVGGLPLRVLHNSVEQSDLKDIKISEEFLDKSACKGNMTEYRDCFILPCKVDGGWSSWGDWTSCSVKCGSGSRRRYRTCSSPKPQHGGQACVGADAQQEPCTGVNCSQWLNWSAWTSCSVSCGSGIQTRVRKCSGPSDTCLGSPKELIPCKMPECPEKWSDWSSWGPCSVTCGSGIRRRHRECLGSNCTGRHLQIERCVDVPVCNKYDKRIKNPQSLYNPLEKPLMKEKDAELMYKNGKSYDMSKKGEYLPSASFIVSPDVKNERNKNLKKTSSVPVNNFKILNSGYESDLEDSEIQSATGDDRYKFKNSYKDNDDDIKVDVILDRNVADPYEQVSYLHGPELPPSNLMEPPSILTVRTCTTGFVYDEDTSQCEDINECQDSQNACHSTQLCENLSGSYRCFCQRGYMSLGTGQRCLDINECLQNIHECSHDCVNMAGTYRCACPQRMKLTTDNRTCVQEESHQVHSYFPTTERMYIATTYRSFPISYPTEIYPPEGSSEDEGVLITRISPKRDKPQRKRRPHKHTFESDYDDYDFKTNRKESLLPVDDDEYAEINDGEGKQRISKQTTWDVVTEIPNEEEKDIYISYESKTEIPPMSAYKIESIFSERKENNTDLEVKSLISPRRNHIKVNSKVTVFGRGTDGSEERLESSDEDSYEDEESSVFEDHCPDGYYLDRDKCLDIDECSMHMNLCNGVTDICINTRGSHMCLPTQCPERYKRNSDGICEQHCDERHTICSQGAALTQSVVYIVISTSVQETKVPGAIMSLQYGGIKNHTMYALDRQPRGETFYVSTDDKTGTIHTLMSPTLNRVNRIIVSGKIYDETDVKLLHYFKFVIYLYISD